MKMWISFLLILILGSIIIMYSVNEDIDAFKERRALCNENNGSFISKDLTSNRCVIEEQLYLVLKTEDGYKLVEK